MIIPGYEIIRQIGSGGMATVYLAIQKSLHREVALKILTPGLAADKSYCQRFLKEGRIAAQLSHVNLVTVYDIGVHDNDYYMATEYLSAGTVREKLKRGLTEEQIVRIVADIAKGLNYAHAKGFVHRDVKPGNMLFRDDDSCVLGDFGIAKAVDSNTGATQIGTSIGTPHYMSPEQARGEKVDHRTDIYSLGVVFYELLAGEPPFDATDPFSVALKQISSPTPRVPERYEKYQPLIDRLMQKDRALRYETAAAFVEDLAQTTDFLITGPITSPSQELVNEAAHAEKVAEDAVRSTSNASRTPIFAALVLICLMILAYVFWPDADPSQVGAKHETIADDGGDPIQPPAAAAPRQVDLKQPDPLEEEVAALVQRAQDQLRVGNLIAGDASGAVGLYQSALLRDPDQRAAIAGLAEATDTLLDAINTLRDAGDLEMASTLTDLATQALTNDTRFMILAAQIRSDVEAGSLKDNTVVQAPSPQAKKAVQATPSKPANPKAERAAQLIAEGDAFYQAHKYGFPPGENATDRYLAALELTPDNLHAAEQLEKIAASWADAAQSLMEKGKPDRALGMITLGLRARPNNARLRSMESRIMAQQKGD